MALGESERRAGSVANDRSAEIYVVELCDRMWPVADGTFSVINSVLPPQFQDMLHVRCLRDCKTGSLQTADTELSTIN